MIETITKMKASYKIHITHKGMYGNTQYGTYFADTEAEVATAVANLLRNELADCEILKIWSEGPTA